MRPAGGQSDGVWQRVGIQKRHANVFKPVQLFTVQELFGSLGEAQKVHFNDGGQFDKIYSAR